MNAQIAQYNYPTVHVQIKTADKSRFTESNRRSYGAAFNVEDGELWEALDNACPNLSSLAGTARKYTPAEVEREDNDTLSVTITLTQEFVVDLPLPVIPVIA